MLPFISLPAKGNSTCPARLTPALIGPNTAVMRCSGRSRRGRFFRQEQNWGPHDQESLPRESPCLGAGFIVNSIRNSIL
jgi:hypothetical protein